MGLTLERVLSSSDHESRPSMDDVVRIIKSISESFYLDINHKLWSRIINDCALLLLD